MIHPIVLFGDTSLNQKSGEIPLNFPKIDLEELIVDMFETMHKANGIGLSAVQINVPFRLFIIEANIEAEDFHFRGVFINPKMIREFGPMVKFSEGCLSVPTITASVERHSEIELEYYDENLEFHTKIFSKFEARIIQHEYDHLEGILYVDRLPKMWKEALEEPLKMVREKKLMLNYLTK